MFAQLAALSRRLLHPLHAWKRPPARGADRFERSAPSTPTPHGPPMPAPGQQVPTGLLMALERGMVDDTARARFRKAAASLPNREIEALLNQLETLPHARPQGLASLHTCWGDLFDRFTPRHRLRFARWLRNVSPPDYAQWARTYAPTVARETRALRLSPAERAEVVRIVCSALKHRPTWHPRPGLQPCLGIYTRLTQRDATLAPLALYDALCAADGVDPTSQARFRPWVRQVSRHDRSPATQWEVLELVASYLSPQAAEEAAALVRGLPPCVHAWLAGELPLMTLPDNAALPRGLPQLLLRAMSLGVQASAADAPQAQRALLRALMPHCAGGSPEVLLRCARAAKRLGDTPWPWLACVQAPDGHERFAYTQDPRHRADATLQRKAWVDAIVEAGPPPLPFPPNLRTWATWALGAATGQELAKLVAWVATHPQLELDVGALFEQAAGELDPRDTRTLQHLATLYGRIDRDAQLRAAQFSPFRALLPPLAPALCAQEWLRRGSAECGAYTDALHALRNLLEGTMPTPALRAAFPEFALVETPAEVLSAGLPPTLAAPRWAREAVAREAPGDNAAHAQRNRLRALGHFLLACRASQAPAERVAAVGPLVAPLLALADVQARQRLLDLLVAQVVAQPGNDAAYAEALQLQASVPAKALPLALAALCAAPRAHTDAAARTLLRARKLFNHGGHARSVLSLLLQQDDRQDLASWALCWADPRRLAQSLDGPAPTQREHDALLGAQRAWQAAPGAAHDTWSTQSDTLASLRQAQAISALHAAARAQLRDAWPAPLLGKAARAAALQPLRRALAWLQTLPPTRAALSPLSPLSQTLPAADAPCWDQARAGLKAAKAMAPASEVWLLSYAAGVVQALRSHAPSPRQAAGPPTALDAEFFARPSVRAFLVERVLPLALEVAQYAPLLRANDVALNCLTDASEVLPACLAWTRLGRDELRCLETACPRLRYLTLYAGSMQKDWTVGHANEGLDILRQLMHAALAGRLDAARRAGPQARRLLALPGGEALMTRWERSEPAAIDWPTATRPWATDDTGEPGSMLQAVTDVHSCQSADRGLQNRGMLGRLADGARRMAVLRDADGAVRARAVMRLMQDPEGQPVLLLGPPYIANGAHYGDAANALCAHAARRGADLGVQAVAPDADYRDPPAGRVQVMTLTCAGGLPDYWDWDGAGGLREDTVALHEAMALLANR